MKKSILSLSVIALIAVTSVFTGCKKADTTPPVVTLTGAATMTLSLHDTFTDLGATATDDVDGAVTPIVTGGPVNTNLAGVYTLSYTATDKAGNVSTAVTRTVTVMHTSATLAGTFSVTDVSGTPSSTTTYVDVVTAATGSTVRLNTIKFANYVNTVVYFDLSGPTGSVVTVPTQPITNSGNPAATRQFDGTGTVSDDGKTITINYTEFTNGTSTTGTGTYVKP